jgi:hypothetical protein
MQGGEAAHPLDVVQRVVRRPGLGVVGANCFPVVEAGYPGAVWKTATWDNGD